MKLLVMRTLENTLFIEKSLFSLNLDFAVIHVNIIMLEITIVMAGLQTAL